MKKLLNKLTTWFNNLFKEPKEKFELQEKFKADYDNEQRYYDSWDATINAREPTNISINDFHRIIERLSKSEKYFENLEKLNKILQTYPPNFRPHRIGRMSPIDSQIK